MTELTQLLTALGGIAWPVAWVAIALLFRRFIAQMLTRESVSIKIAGMEVSVADAAKQTGQNLSDLLQRVADLEQRIGGQATSAPAASPADGKEVSVLWVDDVPANNAFIIEKFEKDGIRVRKEISTGSALRALQSDRFNAIISDLGRRENGVDNPFAGLDLVSAVRKAGIETPILIFAGPRGMANRDRLLQAGATEVTASSVDVFRFVNQRQAGG